MKNFQAGCHVECDDFKFFQPNPINRAWTLDNMELIQLLGQADRHFGRLDMFSDYIPDIDLFIYMHVVKEATQSSKIEGTQTNIEDAVLTKDDVPLDKRDDWEEVQNYVEAIHEATIKLQTLPFSTRLIKEAHKTLLQGVRGKHKQPGEFRRSQNWIGGASISDAVFVPPVHTSIGALMADMEQFLHNDSQYFPELLKIALAHYQFETIHPFLDGNGRVGRLLITLHLISKGILKRPVLYLSDFFERNRTHYYDNLMRVRQKDDLLQWFRFFLVGVIETAKRSIETFDGILKLQKEVEAKIRTLGSRAAKAQAIVNHLYRHPVIGAAKVGETAAISPASTYKLIADLERIGILKETTGSKRGRRYLFSEYLDLFQ